MRKMTEQSVSAHGRFEREVMPHLDAAYNLARWLTRDPDDAEDVVQDACVRALRYVDSLRGGGGKAWLLTIVRNAFYDWVSRNRPVEIVHDGGEAAAEAVDDDAIDPEQAAVRKSDARVLADALATLPLQFREAIVLRELEDMSYRGHRARHRRSDRHRHVATRARSRDAAPDAVIAARA